MAGYGGRTRMHYRYGFSMDQFDFALVRCTRAVYIYTSIYLSIYICVYIYIYIYTCMYMYIVL